MSKRTRYIIEVGPKGHPIGEPQLYDPRRGRMPNEVYTDGESVEGKRFVNGRWITCDTPPVYEAPKPRVITVLQLRRLFTFAEKVSIEEAIAEGNPALKVFMDDLAVATEVDLDDPLVNQGLSILASSDLISEERKQQILLGEELGGGLS